MTSITELIINEIANVLGIPPSEVKSRFTEQQLKELYDLSLCEPTDEVGAPFGQISDLPCEEPAPQLLPPIDIGEVEELLNELKNAPSTNPTEKCIDAVKQVAAELDADRDLYTNYSVLYERLIEYQDNFEPISYYFEERANEMARILSEFGAPLENLKKLSEKKAQAEEDLLILRYTNQGSSAEQEKIRKLQTLVSTLDKQIATQRNTIYSKEKSIPVFTNSYYKTWLQDLNSSAAQSQISLTLGNLYRSYVSFGEMNQVQAQVSQYSQCIKVIEDETPPTSIAQAGNRSFFKFRILFPKLLSFKTEKEIKDPNGDATLIIKNDFPIKGNPLLEKQSFFGITSILGVDELPMQDENFVLGKIYVEYYNLLADPINNFFTLDDRGLTTEAAAVDPRVRGTDSEKKRENNSEYFVKDLDRLQQFYRNFEATFENKKAQKRSQVIDPAKDGLRAIFRNLAKREVQLLLALGRVNKFTAEDSPALKNIVNGIKRQNESVARAAADLEVELARIKKKMDELKPDPQKVKARLKQQSPQCFEKVDQNTEPADCVSVMDKMGIDPLYIKSIREGTDATLPSASQLCYWAQFSIIANLVGLLPLPNVPNVFQLRYWPVGLTIPSPAGLIKIPLPVIWIPLVVIATPMGTIVIFLTINGIFISPIIFFVSSSGFKQHIFTVRGPSPKFGFSANEESIKPGLLKSVSFLALQERVQRLAREAAEGLDLNLNPLEKAQLERQKNILAVNEEDAAKTGNKNKQLRVAREKKNLEEYREKSRMGEMEQLQKVLNKTESAKDAVEAAKRAIYRRIDELGNPRMRASDLIKQKIAKRDEKLLLELQAALEQGDDERAAEIRKKMKRDGVSLKEKIDAINEDMRTFFDKLKFPKITIPKDTSKIDPKPNAIINFLHTIMDFSSEVGSNFFSVESLTIKNLLAVQLAKLTDKIQKKIEAKQTDGRLIDIEKDFDKVQEYLLDMNSELVDGLKGEGGGEAAVKSQAAKVDAQREQVKNEKDPKKKKELEKKLQQLQVQFSEIFDNTLTKEFLSFTPEVLLALSQVKVEFNPFAPCCAKQGFELDLSALSPAIPIIESVRLLLDSHVKSLTPQQIKSLVGGKKAISPREMTSLYLGIIKQAVPLDLAIPIPSLNLLALAKSFTGLFTSLFEIKMPNPAAQPAVPIPITIDLNLLKPILLEAMLAFLANCLPDPNSAQALETEITSQGREVRSPEEAAALGSQPAGQSVLGPGISIVNCPPADSEESAISDGGYRPNVYYDSAEAAEFSGSTRTLIRTSTQSSFSSGNVVVSSTRDILPAFSTLSFDFLSINPADLLAVLKNFVDLGFDAVEKVLDQFYTAVKLAKSAKGVNFNLLESVQPPFLYLPIVSGVTAIKTNMQWSDNVQITDPVEVETRLNLTETLLGPIAKSPLPSIVAAGAGIADDIFPSVPIPKFDPQTFSFSMVDGAKPSYLTIRSLHPLVSQDDIPSWERLSPVNPLFLLFLDQFLARGADKVGFFREYL